MYGIVAGDRDVTVVAEQTKSALKRPPMYAVFLVNDDFTPMDFVIEVLQIFFDMSLEKAQRVMFQVHTQGEAVCAVYPYDVAETKVSLVTDYARQHEFPLMCDLKPCPNDNE
jgi:ATP-dependent Clp protease adaptor protein ClpS